MFEYLELDSSDNQEANQGTESLPLWSEGKGNDKGTRSPKPPTPEKVRHMLFGSLVGIDRTIKILHALGYADPNDWSDPVPMPANSGTLGRTPNQWMVILTKTLLVE